MGQVRIAPRLLCVSTYFLRRSFRAEDALGSTQLCTAGPCSVPVTARIAEDDAAPDLRPAQEWLSNTSKV